jgi:hypothetical protein
MSCSVLPMGLEEVGILGPVAVDDLEGCRYDVDDPSPWCSPHRSEVLDIRWCEPALAGRLHAAVSSVVASHGSLDPCFTQSVAPCNGVSTHRANLSYAPGHPQVHGPQWPSRYTPDALRTTGGSCGSMVIDGACMQAPFAPSDERPGDALFVESCEPAAESRQERGGVESLRSSHWSAIQNSRYMP